jgi:hypothetical protein
MNEGEVAALDGSDPREALEFSSPAFKQAVLAGQGGEISRASYVIELRLVTDGREPAGTLPYPLVGPAAILFNCSFGQVNAM